MTTNGGYGQEPQRVDNDGTYYFGPDVREQCRQIGCADLALPTGRFCGGHSAAVRLQRPEGCLDAFVEALMGDPWIGTLIRNSPIQFGADSMRRTVEYALERAGVILAMRR